MAVCRALLQRTTTLLKLGDIAAIDAAGFDRVTAGRCLEHGVRPVIKHRVFDSLDNAHNARIDDNVYHQRSTVEPVIRVLKLRYGDRLPSRTWNGQFRELARR